MKKVMILLVIWLPFLALVVPGAGGHDGLKEVGILYTKPINSVLFSHNAHLEQKLSCIQCHNGLFDMKALKAQEKKDFNMDALYKGKYCGACHNGKQAFASNTQCAHCHVRIKPGQEPALKEKMPAFTRVETMGKGDNAVRFRHEIHEKKASCIQCHPKPFLVKRGVNKITYADHTAKKACFSCHDGAKSFPFSDCNSCHIKTIAPNQAIIVGKSSKAVTFRHDSHKGKNQCKSCHTELFSYKKGEAKVTFADHSGKKSCFTCHNGAAGAPFYTCNGCHKDKEGALSGKATAKKPQGPQAALIYKMEGAGPVYFNHPSHAGFECKACHPDPFAMQKGQTKMTMAQMYKGQSCGTCHNGKKAFKSYDCAKCHKEN